MQDPYLSKIARPLFSKVGKMGKKYFNQEDINLVKKIKTIVIKLPPLALPLINDYLIIETDRCSLRGELYSSKTP